MTSCSVGTAIDVAAWLLEWAREEDGYPQPQKLQRLLFCAQACYGQEYQGRRLMPARFLVHELGPVESNVFRIFEAGRPDVVIDRPPAEVEPFPERVWRRYARISVERPTTIVTSRPVYRKIAAQGEVIPFKAVLALLLRSATTLERTRTADDSEKNASQGSAARNVRSGCRLGVAVRAELRILRQNQLR